MRLLLDEKELSLFNRDHSDSQSKPEG